MLNTITWEQFLTATAVVIVLYYIVIAVIFFREELTRKMRGSLPGTDDETSSHPIHAQNSDDLVGSPITKDTSTRTLASSVEAQQIHFGQSDKVEDNDNALADSRETILIGTVADLIQEIKLIVDSKPEDREAIIQLLKTLLSRYEQLESTQYKQTICHFLLVTINDKTNHTFTITEIRSWWSKP